MAVEGGPKLIADDYNHCRRSVGILEYVRWSPGKVHVSSPLTDVGHVWYLRGCFICIRCSGIHRSMGTHISKVKSVDLDMWTPDQMAVSL